jgi:very-short-patch-repair endonuclease
VRVKTTPWKNASAFTRPFANLHGSCANRKPQQKQLCGNIYETGICSINSGDNNQSISSLIIDFYCAEAKLLIEIDGPSHLEKEQEEYDKARSEYLETLGYKVIRFTNNDVRYNINAVITAILEEVEKRITEPKHPSS